MYIYWIYQRYTYDILIQDIPSEGWNFIMVKYSNKCSKVTWIKPGYGLSE